MINAGDRKSVRKAEKAARLTDLNRGEVLRQVMSTIPGRAWIWERLSASHVFETSFAENAIYMAFREGERNQGIMLMNDLMQWCPDEFILAMREANARRRDNDATDDNLRDDSTIGELHGDAEPGRIAEGPASADGGEDRNNHNGKAERPNYIHSEGWQS